MLKFINTVTVWNFQTMPEIFPFGEIYTSGEYGEK
jgi:hypothetical protein